MLLKNIISALEEGNSQQQRTQSLTVSEESTEAMKFNFVEKKLRNDKLKFFPPLPFFFNKLFFELKKKKKIEIEINKNQTRTHVEPSAINF